MKTQANLMLSAGLAALSLAMAAPTAALAQDVREAGDTQNDKSVSELVVTGVRELGLEAQAQTGGPLGDKSVLDTPFSITVVDAAEIEKRQPATIAQLFVNDPAVFSFASAGTVNWWGTQIRGLGVRNYYIDDVPLVLYWGGDYPLESVETVQALKGATGFMYGFGAPGGAIVYRTKRPTEAPLLSTKAGWRGRSVATGHLDAGGPVTQDGGLGYRLTLAGATGEEYNASKIQTGVGSLAVDYEVAPNLTWRSNITYEDYTLEREPFHIYWTGSELPSVPDDWDNQNVDNSSYSYTTLTAATALEWRLNDDWSVDATYGYTRKRHRSNKIFTEIDNPEGDYDAYVYQFGELDEVHFVQAMTQGRFSTGSVRHAVVLGTSYQAFESAFSGDYGNLFFDGNIFEPQTYLIPGAVDYSADDYLTDERQYALFASDTLYFGDHWQAIVGLRSTWYNLDSFDAIADDPSSYNTAALTPTVAVLYKPSPRATIYASYVESLEPGSVVGAPYANIGEVLEATISRQYEVGAKYDGQRLSFTAAAFRVERANQLDRFDGPDRYLTQDGLTLYDGVEAIGQFRVSDDLTLGLGAVHLDASIEDADDADILGKRPAESSEWQIVGNAEYNVPIIEGLSIHGSVRYYGDAPTDDYNTLIVPDYTLVSGGFNYRIKAAGRDVVITGNVNNLLNERYWGLQNFGESINGSLGVTVDW